MAETTLQQIVGSDAQKQMNPWANLQGGFQQGMETGASVQNNLLQRQIQMQQMGFDMQIKKQQLQDQVTTHYTTALQDATAEKDPTLRDIKLDQIQNNKLYPQYGLGLSDDARDLIHKSDDARGKMSQLILGKDMTDPSQREQVANAAKVLNINPSEGMKMINDQWERTNVQKKNEATMALADQRQQFAEKKFNQGEADKVTKNVEDKVFLGMQDTSAQLDRAKGVLQKPGGQLNSAESLEAANAINRAMSGSTRVSPAALTKLDPTTLRSLVSKGTGFLGGTYQPSQSADMSAQLLDLANRVQDKINNTAQTYAARKLYPAIKTGTIDDEYASNSFQGKFPGAKWTPAQEAIRNANAQQQPQAPNPAAQPQASAAQAKALVKRIKSVGTADQYKQAQQHYKEATGQDYQE